MLGFLKATVYLLYKCVFIKVIWSFTIYCYLKRFGTLSYYMCYNNVFQNVDKYIKNQIVHKNLNS